MIYIRAFIVTYIVRYTDIESFHANTQFILIRFRYSKGQIRFRLNLNNAFQSYRAFQYRNISTVLYIFMSKIQRDAYEPTALAANNVTGLRINNFARLQA